MKRLIHLLITLVLLALFIGCSTVGFAEKPLKENTSTIYTYVETPSSVNENMYDPCYKIDINNKSFKSCMKIEEFMEFKNLKAQEIIISATRDEIDKKTMKLDLVAGNRYFLRVQSTSQIMGQFEFTQVSKDVALKSIGSMKMANPPKKKDEGMFDFFASEEKSEVKMKEAVDSLSKLDEIKKANEMKEQGIITDVEFKKLKSEILAK